MKSGLYGALLAMLLAGCSTQSVRTSSTADREAAYDARAGALAAAEQWGLSARLGIVDGEDGGSGRLEWSSQGTVESEPHDPPPV